MCGTGTHCEVDLRHNCSRDTCVGGARCVPLIRGGFRCELCRRRRRGGVTGHHAAPPPSSCVECQSVEDRSPFCELLSRRFPRRGSFLMFPPLKQRHRFRITLRSVAELAQHLNLSSDKPSCVKPVSEMTYTVSSGS